MLIRSDPDAYIAEAEHRTCPFHQQHPFETYAGCTCSAAYRLRPATGEERAENRRKRLEGEREHLERALASIRAQLRLTP